MEDQERIEAHRKKMAIVLSPETNKNNAQATLAIYGFSFLGMIITMFATSAVSILAIVAMVIAMAFAAWVYIAKGEEDISRTLMAVAYLFAYIITFFTTATDIYPFVFIAVFSLLIYQDVLLVRCGAYGSLVIHAIGTIIDGVQGGKGSGDTLMIVSSVACTIFAIMVAKRIYKTTDHNLSEISKQTEAALAVAKKVTDLSNQIADRFTVITEGIEDISTQANDNRDALREISSTSATNSEEAKNQSFEATSGDVSELKSMVDGILEAINEISKHTGVIADSVVSVSENSGKMNELTDKGEAEAESIYEIINQFKDTIAELNQDIAELKDTVSEN